MGSEGQTRRLERWLGSWSRKHLSAGVGSFALFVFKQGWACLFGGILLAAILLTKLVWNTAWPVQRYDALFGFAVVVQVLFLIFRLETWKEVQIIVLFHLTGTVMEWFKVHMGSWAYPGGGFFKIMDVPLFSGFMYASVGSYIARVIRIFEMRFEKYPPFAWTLVLAVAIYLNFFTHHFFWDCRWLLFVATVLLYGRTWISFRVATRRFRMFLPLAALLSSLALWVAENVGTFGGIWLYPRQHMGEMVGFGKVGAWYLLLYVAFITVSLMLRFDRAEERG